MISLASLLASVRGLHLAASVSLLGTVGFIAWILPAASVVPEPLRGRLTRLWGISALIAFLAGLAWLTIQSAVMAGTASLTDVLEAVPTVAAHTRFGNVLLARLGLLFAAALATLAARRAPRIAGYLTLTLVTVALGLQGLIGHAGATGGAIGAGLVLSESCHLFAAGIWLGSLLPLWITLGMLAPTQAAAVCERFSPIGLVCVLVLADTGVAQALNLIGSLPALFGTQYGRFATLKITLFLFALVLAGLNRLWLTDRLAAGSTGARRQLRLSVFIETSVGLAIVTAASFMASSPPAAHDTPVWPFSWQFSLITVNEDADFRQEVIISLVAIGAAVGAIVVALLLRRFRVLALAILAATVALRGPSLSLLTVEAYPTSFETSPTGFSAASIVAGQALYVRNCVACHGPQGRGDGPAASGLRIRPADLTLPHLREHTDGEMFWWLTHGIDDPEGNPGEKMAMPGFANTLSAEDRWALIDYVRARNVGLAIGQEAAFDVPVSAPAFPVTCAGVGASTSTDLRGHAVHVVADAAAETEIPPQVGISTVNLALLDEAAPAPGSCVAANPAAWQAFAILAGLPPDKLSGAEFLIDPEGWLRAIRRPGAVGGWQSGESLIAAINEICASPIPSSGDPHAHHH